MAISGEPLRGALVEVYKTSRTFSCDRARDSMFVAVYFEPDPESTAGTASREEDLAVSQYQNHRAARGPFQRREAV